MIKRASGPVTIFRASGVLAAILDDAVRDRLIPANPARGVKLPNRTKPPNINLSGDHLHALADESGRHRGLGLLLGTVGWRWGEAAALRVADVDFLRHRITLHRNAVKVGGTVHVGSLKPAGAAPLRWRGSWQTRWRWRWRVRVATT